MKQNSLVKDFFVEIKKTWTRFLSILVMVLLGVAFYAGLRATSPDMDLSADSFYDDQNLMDIRVLGTLGVTEEDVVSISEIDGLSHVQGGYSYDVFCVLSDMRPVIRLMSLYEEMNEVLLSEGRMPENATECVVDNRFLSNHGYQIGDTITLEADDEEEITDIIKSSELTIVGAGCIPQFLSLERGTTSIGNGELDSFILLLPEAFSLETYTEICMRTEGTKEYIYTSDSYEDMIEQLTKKLEDISGGRCEIRYETIMSEAKEELNDAKREVADGEEKLLEAKEELADAEIEIADAWREIDANERKLLSAKRTIDSKTIELQEGKAQIEDGYVQLDAAQAELDAAQMEIDSYYDAVASLPGQKQQLASEKASVESIFTQYGISAPSTVQEVSGMITGLSAQKNMILGQMEDPSADFALLQQQLAMVEGQIQLLSGWNTILENEVLLQNTELLLQQKETEIIEGQEQIAAGREEIAHARAELDANYAQILAGEQELASGLSEYYSGVSQLRAAKATLQEKEQEFLDAKAEFEEEKPDAEAEIADAKEEIADAEAELSDLEVPEWYILDRNTIMTYVEFDQNSQRIDAIAKVFPALFFLVATLVCLTTMTRMVEENRIQIGTLKALGYGKLAIAGKYLAYAILATLLGSVLGIIIGQKVIPITVIQAYGILYDNLPQVLAPLHLQHSLVATVIALFCMMAATMFACYKELLQTPASLMRPEAPKAGKRVLIERITFIWNRLNFTNKSTIRNLFRYKKRFLMTVFGIGACMALLMVGFGVKDSIKAIGDYQFGEIRIYDGEIVMEEGLDEQSKAKILETIDADSRISSYMPVYETSMDIADANGKNAKSSYVLVPSDNDKLSEYVSLRGRVSNEEYKLDSSGVIISEKLATILDVEEGDTVLLQEDEMHSVPVKVAHIAENYFFHYIYMDQELYYELYHEKPEFREYYTINTDNADAFEKQMRSDYMGISGVEEVSFITKTADHITKMLSTMDVLIYVIIVAAGLLAYVVLYNLNNINISERKRELATLKVLGFYDGEVSAYVFRENILLTICGCIAGVFMGIPLHRFVILTAEVDNMMFGREIQLHSYIYSIILTFVFSFLVNVLMHFKLKKINMVESLKSVE